MSGCKANERKILVGVDEGDESMYALSWCLKNVVVPQNSKDTLVLLYAKKPRPVYPIIDGSTGYNNELAESRMEKAKKLFKEVHNLDVKVETRIESGDPRDVICQAAEKLSADVVVLGSHGYGLIKRTFLGSVSNYCAQKAKCPVLIAKRPESTPHSKY